MKTTDFLLLGILFVLFGGVAILGDVVFSYEWAVITLWLGLFVGVGGVVANQFTGSKS
ncbi:hypothetical protein [Haladaptatus cibarius]|uniref:hypothetical protein n=1 Tax=Haladaptatus cibarius TaxID=453847 RepID=UPI000AA0D60C|nr:hypothetical protein [Haladaptatus cibarius]